MLLFVTSYRKDVINIDEEIIFPKGSVPVSVAAKVYGKNSSWIRAGIIYGWLPIGKATKDGKIVTNLTKHSGRINYYISPRDLYYQTGYLWKGK